MNHHVKIATTAVVGAALPVNLLIDFGYSLFSIEVLIVALCLGIAGGVIGALTANSFIYSYFLALLIYFFVEIYYFSWTTLQITLSMLTLLSVTLLLRLTDTKLLPYLIVFAVFFSLSALFKSQPAVLTTSGLHRGNSDSPDQSLLHIILDEMASPYDSEFPPSPGHPAATLLDDLASSDFRVEAQAYSVSVQSVQSLSALVALDSNRLEFEAFHPGAVIANRVADNVYLRALVDSKFDVSVLQSSYLDYCTGLQGIVCQTYSRTGHVSAFSSSDLSERLKFVFMLLNEALTSNTRTGILLYSMLVSLIDTSDPLLDFYVPLIAHNLMQEKVLNQAAAIEPGEAHFIHLLLPHFPFVYGPDCQRLPISEWGYPVRHSLNTPVSESYARYWDQVACVKSLLADVIRVTADKEYLTTIVHGDHGARILWLTGEESRDDNLKTFLAVRSAQNVPGVVTEPVSLQDSVAGLLEPLIRSVESPISETMPIRAGASMPVPGNP